MSRGTCNENTEADEGVGCKPGAPHSYVAHPGLALLLPSPQRFDILAHMTKSSLLRLCVALLACGALWVAYTQNPNQPSKLNTI